MRCSNSASFAGAQQHLSLYVELFAVNQIQAGQLRLQDLTDFSQRLPEFTNAFRHGLMNLACDLFDFFGSIMAYPFQSLIAAA